MIEIIKVTVSPMINIAEKLAPALHEKLVGQVVRFGDTIRLKHVNTNHVLHSHNINYLHTHSSGQQQVTARFGHNSNDYWFVKAQHGLNADARKGEPVRHGDVVRLQHVATKRNLHSHSGIPSPLTSQQEVTAFGDQGEGDENDNWKLEVEGKGIWYKKKRIRLVHLETGHSLHSHSGHSHPDFTAAQQEITCFDGRDNNDFWVVD